MKKKTDDDDDEDEDEEEEDNDENLQTTTEIYSYTKTDVNNNNNEEDSEDEYTVECFEQTYNVIETNSTTSNDEFIKTSEIIIENATDLKTQLNDTDLNDTCHIHLLTKNSGYLIAMPTNNKQLNTNSIGNSIRSTSSMSGMSSSNTSSSSSLSISTGNTSNTNQTNITSPNKTLTNKINDSGHTSLNTEIYNASSLFNNGYPSRPLSPQSLFRDKTNQGMSFFMHFLTCY